MKTKDALKGLVLIAVLLLSGASAPPEEERELYHAEVKTAEEVLSLTAGYMADGYVVHIAPNRSLGRMTPKEGWSIIASKRIR